MRRELDAVIAADKILQQLGGKAAEIEIGSGVERNGGIKSKEFCSFFGTNVRKSSSVLQFAESVASHRKRSHSIQAIFGMPDIGRKSSELKFDGQAGTVRSGQARD